MPQSKAPHSLAKPTPSVPKLPKKSEATPKINQVKSVETAANSGESKVSAALIASLETGLVKEPLPSVLDTSPRTISIRALVDTIKPIMEHPVSPMTPLLFDPSFRVNLFFEYSADYSGLFIDAKRMLVETLILKKWSMQDALEYLRCQLVNAMKYGRTLVICLLDSATDFIHKFNSPTHFPSILFSKGGQSMQLESNWEAVIREQDKDYGVFVCRPEFKVVVTSSFQLEDIDLLQNSIPLSEMIPIFIEPA
jgi:hypothetical protein